MYLAAACKSLRIWCTTLKSYILSSPVQKFAVSTNQISLWDDGSAEGYNNNIGTFRTWSSSMHMPYVKKSVVSNSSSALIAVPIQVVLSSDSFSQIWRLMYFSVLSVLHNGYVSLTIPLLAFNRQFLFRRLMENASDNLMKLEGHHHARPKRYTVLAQMVVISPWGTCDIPKEYRLNP